MAAKVFKSVGKFGLALVVAGGVVSSALYNVDAGHRPVIFDRFSGIQDVVVGEGTHFLIPWVQKSIIFDCRSQPRNVLVITGSKDLRNMNITPSILFRPLASQFPRIYTSVGEDYDQRVLPSFILGDMFLTHLTFGKEFTEAVEAKQVAQQEVERARFVVEKAEQQKKAAIISSESYSKAAELIANSPMASLSCRSWKLLRTLRTSSPALRTSPTCAVRAPPASPVRPTRLWPPSF